MYQMQRVDSFEAWKSLVSSAFVPLHSEPVRAGAFAGSIAGSQFGSVGVMQVEATAHAVRRTENQLAAGDAPHFKLNLQLSGHGMLLQDGRETLLRPGELAIYDTQRPYTLMFEEDFKTLVLMFPQHQLGLPVAKVRETDGHCHRNRTSPGPGRHAIPGATGGPASAASGSRGPSAGRQCH